MPAKPLIDATAQDVLECLKQSYLYVNTDRYGDGSPFDKAERAEKMYRHIIDADEWMPQSEVFLPFAHAVVDTIVPTLSNYIFTQDDLFQVIPVYNDIDPATLQLIESYLAYDVQDVMNLKFTTAPTIQDAAKLGVGYGMIDYRLITPETWHNVTVLGQKKSRVKFRGKPEYQLRYNHLPFASVFPSPQGDGTVEGQEYICVIRFKNIKELEALAKDDDRFYEVDWEKLKQDAIERKITYDYTGAYAFARGLTKLGESFSNNIPMVSIDYNAHNVPVLLPVIEYYSHNQHVWVANGTTTIYQVESDGEKLFNPLVKAQLEPNDGNWFQQGILEKNFDIFDGTNQLFNSMLDSLDFQLRPRFIKDTSVITGELNLGPWETTHGTGDVTKALQTLDPNGFNDGSLAVLNFLNSARNVGTGQMEQLQGGATPGLVRGGMSTFESLLQTTGARDEFASELLATGFFRDVLWKTLNMEQLLIGNRSRQFTQQRGDDKKYKMMTITQNDLRQNLDIRLSLSKRLKNSVADRQIRMNTIQLLMQNPAWARMINPLAAIQYVTGSKDEAGQLIKNADPQAYDRLMQLYEGKNGSQGGAGLPGMGGAGAGAIEGGA